MNLHPRSTSTKPEPHRKSHLPNATQQAANAVCKSLVPDTLAWRRSIATVLALASVFVSTTALSHECSVDEDFVYQRSTGSGLVFDPEAPIEASADSVVTNGDTVELTGDTEITYQGRTLSAENAIYNKLSGEVAVDGALRYESDGVTLSTKDAEFNIGDSTFATGRSDYQINLDKDRATGKARTISRNENGLFRMENATYSTCPPGDRSWYLQAKDIVLDTEEGIGTAKNITLHFKGVPILALPWFSFPISPDRKTGFLAPSFGSSESTGFEFRLPWYWNIRPNLDLTLTPRVMTRRGVQLQSELRYLNRQGAWRLDSEVLFDNEQPAEERRRTFFRLRHAGALSERWTTALDISEVSDDDYFEDLGDSLQVASISHLERRADLQYSDGTYSFLARAQSFQTIDQTILDDDLPYRKLPQLRFNADWPGFKFGLEADLDAEVVFFDRDASVTGTRFDISPSLTWPIVRSAWYVKPKISTRYTYYDLNNTEDGNPSQIERDFSSASVEAGLFFDRPVNNRGKIQTLEPRVFLLRVPFEDQDAIPQFDSLPLDFNFSQLFRENRFSGSDRVADANQISLALTTRLIDARNGREELQASIGQIIFFDDRQVTVDGEVETRASSDVVAELEADLDNNWTVRSSLQWNPDESLTTRSAALVSYRPDEERIFNLGHRRVSNATSAETEQIDVSLLWPVLKHWRVAARWNYSIAGNTSLESLLGLQYDDCCWALRFAARRFISDDGSDHETNFHLQLVLKGLAPLGDNIGELLQSGVLGYEDRN